MEIAVTCHFAGLHSGCCAFVRPPHDRQRWGPALLLAWLLVDGAMRWLATTRRRREARVAAMGPLRNHW